MIRIFGTLAGLAWVVFMAWGAMREYQAAHPDHRGRRALQDGLLRHLRFPKRKE